ncbi:hypothetical protein C5167_044552 [Papaver somniferum]|uniref:HAT C-terminal dimerisation domain-containing protein n=1 Tax=Papaver somniferum TaxID=3469 RepID=A0A4Y7LCQ4_PAPSO|nr:hypothetical protein C5167_044552 [Papaver somniferum]
MNPFLFIVVLLDPRQKEVGLNFRLEILCKDDLERVAELRDCVKKDLERLFNEYNLRYLVDNEATSIAQDTEMVEAGVDSLDIMEALLKGRLEKRRMESVSIEGRSEVERDILAIPVSSVASESAFSTGKRVLDPFRSSLSPRTVQALILTQNWLRTPLNIDVSSFAVDNAEEIETGATWKKLWNNLSYWSFTYTLAEEYLEFAY